jgi:putative mRNA 3-end processing factor
MLIEPTDAGLYCAAGGFHIDPWKPVARAVITHAHGDHLRPGSHAYLCSTGSLALVRQRLGADAAVTAVAYGESVALDGVRVRLHPAGHILGSAQVRVEHRGEVWVASGDYKRQPDPTCAPCEPQRCEAFITEATFALPVFRWDPPPVTVAEITTWIDEMRAANRPAVIFAYALGKAQHVLAELHAAGYDRPVYVHGALEPLIELYRSSGVAMPPVLGATRTGRGTSFGGELIMAPVSARGSTWMRRFRDHSAAFVSGWMRIRGARRRRGYDRGFALSDHADWPELLQTVEDTGARRVFVTHGYTDALARYLTEHGLDAQGWQTQYVGEPASPEPASAIE